MHNKLYNKQKRKYARSLKTEHIMIDSTLLIVSVSCLLFDDCEK